MCQGASTLLSVVSFLLVLTLVQSLTQEVLYDAPVSNHGARVRLIVRLKELGDKIAIKDPQTIGGVKSEQYLSLNRQGKSPLLITDTGFPLSESDTIARYLTEKYPHPPTFIPNHILQRSLSDQICRIHDIYVSPIQSCMYRAPGNIFGPFGSDRGAALQELQRQLQVIEEVLTKFYEKFPEEKGDFLCGKEISLAAVTLFPTMIFCDFMLPQFFGLKESEYKGPILSAWSKFFSDCHPKVIETKEEILTCLEVWKEKGRFVPIVEEMR